MGVYTSVGGYYPNFTVTTNKLFTTLFWLVPIAMYNYQSGCDDGLL